MPVSMIVKLRDLEAVNILVKKMYSEERLKDGDHQK